MNSSTAPVLPMVKELLSYDDERFLQCAYYTILGRRADRDGLRIYLQYLRAGTSKLRILLFLAKSPERRSNGAGTVALEIALIRQMIFSWPVLGPFLRVILRETPTPRIPDYFDPVWYLQEYPDVAKARISPYYHYINYGMLEGRCPAFDSDWYLSEYADVVASGYSPRDHYNKYGRAQKRYPWFDASWYLRQNPDVVSSGMDAHAHYIKIGRSEGRQPAYCARNDYLKWVATFDALSTETRATMHVQASLFAHKPLISIVLPVCNASAVWLLETLGSVVNQIYPNWELCIAYDSHADSATRAILERYVSEDHRIKTTFREENGRIAAAKNSALTLATGEWTAFLGPADLLAESALFWIVDAINRMPNIAMIYSDEDKINARGVRFDPYFKCDWNPDLFYSHNMFSNLGIYPSSLIKKIGGFRIDLDDSEDYDLTLRCTEFIRPNQIHHIPRVLFHWRVHGESTGTAKAARFCAGPGGLKALNEHLLRLGVNAKADSTQYGYRVRYCLPESPPLVSLIIPTRNGLSLLRKCVESIILRTDYRPFEILIVDNGSDDPETLHYMKGLGSKEGVRVIRDDRPFNYSALNNAAVKLSGGEVIGLINNDIEVINSDWLSEMVSHALRPEVGAVGARLWYPDDTLQHGGVVLGRGSAWHAHRYIARNDPGYMSRASYIQSLSAVTGACLVIRKSVYEELGGLNETDLTVAFNDVDFCMRAIKAHYRNIWTPYADLYHHESATRGNDDTPAKNARARQELSYMQMRWARELIYDPAYSPNLTNEYEDFSFAWPPRVDNAEFTPL